MGAPRERPILFSASMIHAILDGRKTQTRRIIPNPVAHEAGHLHGWRTHNSLDLNAPLRCPYGARGDRLWVRETFHHRRADYHCEASTSIPLHPAETIYRADFDGDCDKHEIAWRPSIHMPRWASRITLRVTDVRVQRLQEISNEDAVAEGFAGGAGVEGYSESNPADPYEHFALGWDAINGDRASWDSNPWVWAIGFVREMPEARG